MKVQLFFVARELHRRLSPKTGTPDLYSLFIPQMLPKQLLGLGDFDSLGEACCVKIMLQSCVPDVYGDAEPPGGSVGFFSRGGWGVFFLETPLEACARA